MPEWIVPALLVVLVLLVVWSALRRADDAPIRRLEAALRDELGRQAQASRGDLGTFPLVGGQRDRFSVSLSMGLPGRAAELDVLAGRGGDHALEDLRPVAGTDTWLQLRREVDEVYVHPVVATYALDLVDSIRAHTGSRQPLSTRAALALVRLARAVAVADGRSYVAPDDVQAVAVAALSHRIIDVTNDDLTAARTWVASILGRVPVPPRTDR